MAQRFNSDEKVYLDMLYLKTATLIEAAAEASALLAGKDSKKYAVYGKNLGLSFQIIDDILDITQDEATLGKPSMNDFVEGKCTLPYIYLHKELNAQDKERLENLHAKKLEDIDTLWIMEMMSKHKSVERSFRLAQELSAEAMEVIKEDVALVEILQTMMKRSY